jgi:hypothetical protein
MKLTDKELKRIVQWFDLSSEMLDDEDLKIYDKINEELEESGEIDSDDSGDSDDDSLDYYYDEDED